MTSSSPARVLADAIAEQGRKRRWVARQIGIQETYLVAMLNGRRPLQPHYAERIADLLGIPRSLVSADPAA